MMVVASSLVLYISTGFLRDSYAIEIIEVAMIEI